jgi:hypothetical protein
MDRIDWDALTTAVVESAVLMMVALFSGMAMITLVVIGILFSSFIYFGGLVIIFLVLTLLFYKYEHGVNEEDS